VLKIVTAPTPEARPPRRDASWRSRPRRKENRSHTPQSVTRSRLPFAADRNPRRTGLRCPGARQCLLRFRACTRTSSECALPTGRGSWCFRHGGGAPSNWRTGRTHIPRFQRDRPSGRLRRAFPDEQALRNQGTGRRSLLPFRETASRPPAIRNLTGRTTSACRLW
jgi:hypothetical protein